MYQLYYKINASKTMEEYNTYEEAVNRIIELKAVFINDPSFYISIIRPDGTEIRNAGAL